MNTNSNPEPRDSDPDLHVRTALSSIIAALLTSTVLIQKELPVRSTAAESRIDLQERARDVLGLAMHVAQMFGVRLVATNGPDIDDELQELLRDADDS